MDIGFASHQHDFIFHIINFNMCEAGIIMTLEQDSLPVLINGLWTSVFLHCYLNVMYVLLLTFMKSSAFSDVSQISKLRNNLSQASSARRKHTNI